MLRGDFLWVIVSSKLLKLLDNRRVFCSVHQGQDVLYQVSYYPHLKRQESYPLRRGLR